jgi:sister chromatid cohesion protein DCC1
LSGDTPGNAVLCTPDKTFNIRQKNSSNTVYILQPGQDDTSSIAEPGLTGISKPESTLETLPITNFTAAAHIRRLLPVLTTTGQLTGTRDSSTKSQLLKNVPFSDSECEVAYRELSVFVQSTTDHCIVPSAQLKIETWLSMLENTRANGIDLTSELDQDAMLSLKDGLEDLETGLCDAIVHSFTSTNAEGRTSIDSDRLLRWVGLNRLEADALKTPISIATFKASWKDALPEKLRGKVEISLLSDRHQLSAGGKSIAFKDYALDLAVGADSAGVAGAKSTLGTKRKWHDKFKPAKKAA